MHLANEIQKVQYVDVTDHQKGQRIDNFLLGFLNGVPRSLVYKWLRKGEVRVNRKRVKPVYRLCVSDRIRIPPVKLEKEDAKKHLNNKDFSYLESYVIYEDDDLIVLNKPIGLAVHGGSGLSSGLIERMQSLRPQCVLSLVHRLDKQTSGVLLIAKKYQILKLLHEQLRKHQIQKIYHAVVAGHPSHNTFRINKPLKKNVSRSGERVVQVDRLKGKNAYTSIHVLNHDPLQGISLVEAEPLTGRTHQLRVHLSDHQLPIIGDDKYFVAQNQFQRQLNEKARRLYLHACKMRFTLPSSNTLVTFDAPYHDEFNLLNWANKSK